MYYTAYSLNGAWEMHYQEEKYIDTASPYCGGVWNLPAEETEGQCSDIVEKAVPGYWEDMTEMFALTSFFNRLKINPEYGIQRYPIAGTVPDMALPNIEGNFFYQRDFICQSIEGVAAIHFEGVQNAASVWVNEIFLGRHEGYCTPFEMEIPPGVLKNGENTIVLSVSNHRLLGYADEPVSGLTSRAANECTGGVTGEIALRIYTSPLRDAAVLFSEDCAEAQVKIEMTENASCSWQVCDGETVLKSGECSGDFTFQTDGLVFWSPEAPKLYTLDIECGDAVLSRRFGVRRLTADGVHFRLNQAPYYLRGICEHCYFPESIHPNHDSVYYRSIIKTVKFLGFNFIRFHTYIPEEEYLCAADELGMLVHVECPNNTSISEWKEIVRFCRRHPSVVIYCCGNELLIDEPFIEYLRACANEVHSSTDALFSPMSALRGLEYFWVEPEQEKELAEEPFKHHPRRIREVGAFSDLFSSYTNEYHSYHSERADPEKIDSWSLVYQKPRVSHEICIDGSYTDLSLEPRYRKLRVGKTEMFSSLRKHLESKGLLDRAPLYFKNSAEWQRRMRKFCFESVRRSENIAGYDFLGPIDTHWHTFGYDVGMMNEFYELKPGESVRNVCMYNAATVLLTDLGRKTNFAAGETLRAGICVSHYGRAELRGAQLQIRLYIDGKVAAHKNVLIDRIANGAVSRVHEFSYELPQTEEPAAMKLYVTLDGEELFCENEWELYLFPTGKTAQSDQLIVSEGMDIEDLTQALGEGRDVLLLGAQPFTALPTTFRIALAGRTSGNLATVITDHPALRGLPHEGFCGWQFGELLEDGQAVCFETDAVPFHPVIEIVSTHKFVIRQAALFEFCVLGGRLLVCSMNFKDDDPAAIWLRSRLIAYAGSEEFRPKDTIDIEQLRALAACQVRRAAKNSNLAFNPNDKTAVRRKKTE